jgi:hypothetical protein
MNILFHSNQICEQGTEVALFDYALGNKNILKNHSFIAAPKTKVSDIDVLNKFKQNFPVFLYDSHKELHDFAEANKIDLIYKIIHGKGKEEIFHEKIPHFIHCVFSTKAKHGTFYCPISPFLNRWFRTAYPVLPHIVKKFPGNTQTLRETLGIPHDAVVFGGYGGKGSFNIPFVHKTIIEVASKKNIYFIFMNFNSFINKDNSYGRDNIIFLPKNIDINYKETFINTCDAMIHARSDGETFGLSIAEFSVKKRPVITWSPDLVHNTKFYFETHLKYFLRRGYIYATAHLEFLGEKAIRYSSEKDLADIFLNFKEKYLQNINYDCYSETFNEEKVMRTFETIYNRSNL